MTGIEDEAALETEIRDHIQRVKLERREGMSFLYYKSDLPIRRLPEQIGRLDWMTWMDLEGTQVSDLGPLAPLTRLNCLDLRATRVSDLGPLRGMAQMRNLMIEGTPVADLTPLSGMGHLRDLWLNGTAVTDLTPLARCRALRRLSLRNTAVNDLMPLAGLPDLEFLDITGTQVRDLTPVLRLPRFGVGEGEAGIAFADTPAVARDPVLARLCDAQEDPFRLAEDLMDFLTGGAQMQGWRGDA